MNTLYIIRILGSRSRPGRGPYSSHPLQNCRALASLGNTQPPLLLYARGWLDRVSLPTRQPYSSVSIHH